MMEFSDLHSALSAEVANGFVRECRGDNGLRLYCYTQNAVYGRQWSPATLMARGLILDVENARVVATSFEKFFNVGEGVNSIPDLPFETFEKMDGSLIIIFWHDGRWQTATKGSLRSDQAKWAAALLAASDLSVLVPGYTYLAEAIYPENRIVIRYDYSDLVLLAAYDEAGNEFDHELLAEVAQQTKWRIAKRRNYESVSDLIARAGALPGTEEGFVLRFSNGLRLKVKGDEYCRIHALVSRCTPLAMWEVMRAGDDLGIIRRDLPEEFWTYFDGIISALKENLSRLIERVKVEADSVTILSDKDVGLRLTEFPEDVRGLIFPYRKNAGDLLIGRTRSAMFRAIRPTSNVLVGYTPSYAINRVFEEIAA